MRNTLFVLWLLFYPLTGSISEYLRYLEGKKFTNIEEGIAATIDIFIFTVIALILYEKKKETLK